MWIDNAGVAVAAVGSSLDSRGDSVIAVVGAIMGIDGRAPDRMHSVIYDTFGLRTEQAFGSHSNAVRDPPIYKFQPKIHFRQSILKRKLRGFAEGQNGGAI